MKRYILLISVIFIYAFTSVLTAQIRPVIISEVFYDTPLEEDFHLYRALSGQPGGKQPHHNGEFIELYNPSAEDIDISGWKIIDTNVFYRGANEQSYIFPANTVIKAKSVLILAYRHVHSGLSFNLQDLFPGLQYYNCLILYHSVFMLSNKGAKVSLTDKKGNVIDCMSYRHNNADPETQGYFNMRAVNGIGTTAERLKSIQRKDMHVTTSSVLSLQSDYFTGAPAGIHFRK